MERHRKAPTSIHDHELARARLSESGGTAPQRGSRASEGLPFPEHPGPITPSLNSPSPSGGPAQWTHFVGSSFSSSHPVFRALAYFNDVVARNGRALRTAFIVFGQASNSDGRSSAYFCLSLNISCFFIRSGLYDLCLLKVFLLRRNGQVGGDHLPFAGVWERHVHTMSC